MKAIKGILLLFLCSYATVILAQKEDAGMRLPEFFLMDKENKDTLFYAEHVVIYYSPDSSFASIKHQSKYRLVFRLPFHQLRTDHLEAVWDVRGNAMYFHGNETHDRFYSTNPKKMELEFSSLEGYLDLAAKTFKVTDVPGIYTANALVIPDEHQFTFTDDNIPALKDAQIILNSFTRHHHLISDEVTIKSRKEYKHGRKLFYDYYHAPTRKTYHFENVSVNTVKKIEELQVKFTSTITLKIKEEDLFELFENRYFKGEATASDDASDFYFKGHIGILEEGKITWSPYEGASFLGKF